MINNVTLTGRLTKDVEVRRPTEATLVADFTLAVNKPNKEEANFIKCVAFNKTAELLSNYTRKGNLIGLTGSINTDSYEDKDGKRVYITEVIVNSVTFLESKKDKDLEPSEPWEEEKPVAPATKKTYTRYKK